MIAAGGFKDITRISSSSAAMWQQICLTNTDNISILLKRYIDSLSKVYEELKAKKGDELYEFFDSARVYRDSFINASSGPIKRSYAITIDIADEPGALAAIATILALNAISIKNIGIVHNREYEGGVLRIEFYEEASIEKAKNILSTKGYTIYEKSWTLFSFLCNINLFFLIYLFLYVSTIPTTEAKKTIGASLTKKNSNPCKIVPATASSGSL